MLTDNITISICPSGIILCFFVCGIQLLDVPLYWVGVREHLSSGNVLCVHGSVSLNLKVAPSH